ncbi:MFS general substrate transporter [Patellaria atrata CBS 101060]|uniref:MFS general substrate transporter n=1 Tax=Patellaria atrata CBS 101060 TaxID=1346257 RepID=A0A9P4S800_9PEZI|nr:MFS general substrate transporter [Patellaria atrata CBS 101060]
MASSQEARVIGTESARTTYNSDGLTDSYIPREPARPEASHSSLPPKKETSGRRESPIVPRASLDKLSRSNTSNSSSSRSSHDDDRLALDSEKRREPLTPARTQQSNKSTRSRRSSFPFGFVAGLGEEAFSHEEAVEFQRIRTIRSAERGEKIDENLVEWNGSDDPGNPMNWPTWKKWMITIVLALMTFVITFASSVFSTATMVTAKKFGVSTEVMVLGTSLFVLGFAFGPVIWGPLSELYGRKIPLFVGFFIFVIFQIPVAVATNVQTIMVCRFFGGFFGSAPLGIVGGTLADFWGPVDRGIAASIFAGSVFIGPVAGPIAGGFITMSHLGWRWTEYLTAILGFSFWVFGFALVPESYAPVLLQQRARRIRFATKNWAVHAKADEAELDISSLMHKYLLRPFAMLVFEPILLLITLYMALIYGILYLFFLAYPIAFQESRGWNGGVGALPFLGITVGVIAGCLIIAHTTKTRFARKLQETGRVVPEERLIPMIIGGFLMPAGMFWFAWTSSPHISWVPQVLAGIPIGAGILMIFLQGLNYIIDVYLMHANSAIAGNTFVRSFVAAGFPLFATAMYHTLGVDWATSLLGFLTAALFPVPILFYIFGERIRKLSKYSPTA